MTTLFELLTSLMTFTLFGHFYVFAAIVAIWLLATFILEHNENGTISYVLLLINNIEE